MISTMNMTMKLSEPGEGSPEIAMLTSELALALEREAPLEASLAEQEFQPGGKGAPIDWGIIILTLISARGILAQIINATKPFFERHPELEIDFSTGEKHLVLKVKDVAPQHIKGTIEMFANHFDM
jgi:hypothetical protein